MISLLLIMLAASALMSTMSANRMRALNNVRLSSAYRLATELSDWVRQGGLRTLADKENLFEMIENGAAAPVCFSQPCSTEDAAWFYLHHWRHRLLREIPGARIVLCSEVPQTDAAASDWPCQDATASSQSRVIKIGWVEGSRNSRHRELLPRVILALA